MAVSKAFEPNEATQARAEIWVFGRFDFGPTSTDAICGLFRGPSHEIEVKSFISLHLFHYMSCAMMAETEGFEPSIELYNPITV